MRCNTDALLEHAGEMKRRKPRLSGQSSMLMSSDSRACINSIERLLAHGARPLSPALGTPRIRHSSAQISKTPPGDSKRDSTPSVSPLGERSWSNDRIAGTSINCL
jgi:hypothetical protein